MASHRKWSPPGARRPGLRTPAIATAALASVALLTQTAQAAPPAEPRPTLEEVGKKVDDLYHQAETATEKYNATREKTAQQRKRVDTLLDDVARRTDKLNTAREELGSFAAAQYRTGASAPGSASLLLADNPQDYFDQTQLLNRLTSRQKAAVDDYVTERAAASKKRAEASRSLRTLTTSQDALKTAKADVQGKLATARDLLSRLTADEKARLAALAKKKQEAADREAAKLAAERAAAEKKAAETDGRTGPSSGTAGTSSGTTGTSGTPATDSSYAAKAGKAVAFARAQIGKPYVWGATGPGSYDCSGLTQAVWKAAGVTLPRTTYDQVNAGTTVPLSAIEPGDLVFFYGDISHVGLYVGNGMMIHAPKPGAYVREESIFYGGESIIHSVVRPA
ncbi:NlpC/P60 family protein [Streptomyces sp. NPDC048489]|uniref:C40 family peptidase n=1 Tax=Streptomyces sp. NPDC048489 TaxID=3154504 RepID=UPI00342FCCB9